MKHQLPQKTAWAESLPASYFEAMSEVIAESTKGWFTDTDRAEGYDKFLQACFVYGRMDQCMTSVMPWVAAAIPDLANKTALEIGCGNGTSTAPLAMHVRHVRAFDISEEGLIATRKRCDLLGVANVELFYRDTSWIDNYLADPRTLGDTAPDVIFCYALFEHLTPVERIKLLRAAWADLAIGGHFIIVECPNRLHWFDWHSSMLPFADALPKDLALLWYGHSARTSIWQSIRPSSMEELAAVDRSQLYRFGRGASYHEFEIAIGGRFTLTAGPFSPQAINRNNLLGYDIEWQTALENKLAGLTPPVPRDFAACCLDLVVTKTA